MSDVLSEIAEDISITRADLRAGGVMLTPPICTMGEDAHLTQYDVLATLGNGRHLMMGNDPRLPKMPARPRLADFFRHRFVPMVANHLLQSASLARNTGLDDRVVMACLLHGIAMAGLITSDHGYWGAQLIEPYVDAEVSWAVRHHQALRYFPDESVGYSYPEAYIRYCRMLTEDASRSSLGFRRRARPGQGLCSVLKRVRHVIASDRARRPPSAKGCRDC